MPREARIRPRTDADLPALASALVEVHARGGYPVEGVADPCAWLDFPGLRHSWVAEVGGCAVGQIGLGGPDGEDAVRMWAAYTGGDPTRVAVLARLYVLPEARGAGLGERLTRTAMDHARDHGLSLVLDVMAKDRAAIRLYERLDWTRLGEAAHHVEGAAPVPAYCYAWQPSTG
ncbi:GNAT family N-acetyltransferase [Nocardiopsis sp. LOL_012]|uniref:GNAT family N-acetyltransferase n=1 Tax=Nocardiopsis sp. LOL_012 TaxID=3345409 RepID=UPI003A89AAA2